MFVFYNITTEYRYKCSEYTPEQLRQLCLQNTFGFFCLYKEYNGLICRYTVHEIRDENEFLLNMETLIIITELDSTLQNATTITIPAEIDGVVVGRIYYNTFKNCTNLTTLNLQAKAGYKWEVNSIDCSTLTMQQIVKYAKEGHEFQQLPI